MSKNSDENQQFDLYNLEIIVKEINSNYTCSMNIGDKFFFRGGKISFTKNQGFCLYALQSTLPLLPAKQRKNNPNE